MNLSIQMQYQTIFLVFMGIIVMWIVLLLTSLLWIWPYILYKYTTSVSLLQKA